MSGKGRCPAQRAPRLGHTSGAMRTDESLGTQNEQTCAGQALAKLAVRSMLMLDFLP
jgi:hypothetical protein